MKEKNKTMLADSLDVIGYMSAVGFTGVLTYLVYKIHEYGIVHIVEPNIYIRLGEMGLGGATISFLIYKFLKELKTREKKNK